MKISVVRDGKLSSTTTKNNQNHDPLVSRRRMQLIFALILGFSALLFVWIDSIITEEVPMEDSTTMTTTTTGGIRTKQEEGQPHEIVDKIETEHIELETDIESSTAADDLSKDKEATSSSSSSEGTTADSATIKTSSSSSTTGSNSCANQCEASEASRKEMYGGNLLDRTSLLDIARQEHTNLITKLHQDYGADNFENIFVDKEATTSSNGDEQRYRSKYPVTDDGKSIATLKRKFLIKVLTVQTELTKQQSSSEASSSGCHCLPDVQYVWATGGHSAAAGHGNMFNESYTAYMERDLKPIFSALGIDFTGRNYAMGGTS